MRYLLLSLVLLLGGCPAPSGPAGQTVSLKLEADPAGKSVAVKKAVQLHLSFASDSAGSHLMGALIEDGPKSVTTWHVEPEGAATIDPATAKLVVNTPGPFKIWATYQKGDQTLKSNVLEISGEKAASAPVTTAAPPAK